MTINIKINGGGIISINNQNTPKPVRKDAYIKNAGPVNFESHRSNHDGDIMTIASPKVIIVPPTTTIMGAVKTMTAYTCKRLIIADAGTNHLKGIVTSLDIADFMGGGLRHNLLQNRFHGNLLAAVNESIKEIMEEDVVYLTEKNSIKDTLKLMVEKNVGGIPIVDDNMRVKAMVSELDFVKLLDNIKTDETIKDCMSTNVVSINPNMPIGEVTNNMITRGFRRFPIRKDGTILGIVTASDILDYLGSGEIFNKLVSGNESEALDIPVKTLIKKEIITATPDTGLGKAAHLMLKHNIGSLPVVDNDKLTGIITKRDFIKTLI